MIHPTMFTLFKSTPAKHLLPTYLDGLFSFRLYVWSRTLPLVLNHPIFGFGPQTFPLYFPNDDIQGRLNVGLDMKTFYDKPHSWYVQMIFDFGIVGFILYMLILGIGFSPLKSICKNKSYFKEESLLFLCFASGALAYCVTGVFSDSWNGVTIIFWTFLGICYSLRSKILENMN
jgi:O-antigen ligase